MNRRLRQERTVFLLFLGAVFVSLMSALPIITATLPTVRYAQAEQHPSVVTFEQLDRNRDGYANIHTYTHCESNSNSYRFGEADQP